MKKFDKKIKDRNRFFKNGGFELVERAVRKLEEGKIYSKGKFIEMCEQVLKETGYKKKGKQRHFLKETILRYAVGEGYLRPEGSKYRVTKKAFKSSLV